MFTIAKCLVVQGVGGVLVSAAVGVFSLGAHAAEWACDVADTLYSKTPIGAAPLAPPLAYSISCFLDAWPSIAVRQR